ncbi:MAG: hypothetical protein JWL93_1641 [Hyphomicrobiales bacterium]|jgi:hypothetical protein|nr:hypothetical protein [Hyphomicrobiales bacterium]
MSHDPDADAREARRSLDAMGRSSHGVFDSALHRGVDHFAGRDAPAEDRVEVWGRRLGRALGLVFLVVLVVNLATGWFF